MAELKACPFCGGRAERRHWHNSVFWVRCTVCDCSTANKREGIDAVQAWNRRVSDARVAELEAENERLLHGLIGAGAGLQLVASTRTFGDGSVFEDFRDLRRWAQSRTDAVLAALAPPEG
jgi:hypothetical protein